MHCTLQRSKFLWKSMNAAELAQRHGSFEFSFSEHRWRCWAKRLHWMFSIGHWEETMKSVHWRLLKTLRFTKTKVRCNEDVVKATVAFWTLSLSNAFAQWHLYIALWFLSSFALLLLSYSEQGGGWREICDAHLTKKKIILLRLCWGLFRPFQLGPNYISLSLNTKFS